MGISDVPHGVKPAEPSTEKHALPRPGVQAEAGRVSEFIWVRNLPEITRADLSTLVTLADASVHADWVTDAEFARQKLAKWTRALGGVSNEQFTAREREELFRRMATLQNEVTRLSSLNDKQSQAIIGMLTQARKDSKRLGRKDWLLAGIGAGTALVVTGAVPPLFMLHLAVRFIHVFGKWFTS